MGSYPLVHLDIEDRLASRLDGDRSTQEGHRLAQLEDKEEHQREVEDDDLEPLMDKKVQLKGKMEVVALHNEPTDVLMVLGNLTFR